MMPCRRERACGASQRGSALLPVLLLMFLFSAVSIAIAVAVQIEIKVATRFADATPALYAAEAGLAAAIAELRALPSWTPVLAGAVHSRYTDGAFGGAKAVPGAGTVLICCGMQSAVGRLTQETSTSPRPARRTVEWRPFVWSPVHALMPAVPPARSYVIVWIGDDEEDGDGLPQVDANEIVVLRSEAMDGTGARRVVEAYVARQPVASEGGEVGEDEAEAAAEAADPEDEASDGSPVAVRAWREVR